MYLFRRSFYFHEKEGRAAEILGRPPIGSEVMGTGYGIIIRVVSKGARPYCLYTSEWIRMLDLLPHLDQNFLPLYCAYNNLTKAESTIL